jgi:hypothetical protein
MNRREVDPYDIAVVRHGGVFSILRPLTPQN